MMSGPQLLPGDIVQDCIAQDHIVPDHIAKDYTVPDHIVSVSASTTVHRGDARPFLTVKIQYG